ncbi:hypothetical protein VV11_014515 [Trichodesmium erythraeum 21-75]|nr:hypothetical protein [Trichodesmium erythraeum 21-75]
MGIHLGRLRRVDGYGKEVLILTFLRVVSLEVGEILVRPTAVVTKENLRMTNSDNVVLSESQDLETIPGQYLYLWSIAFL